MSWSRRSRQRRTGRAWRRLVAVVVARDGGVCHICERPGAMSVDHVVALANGGTDALDNLKASHLECNARKGRTEDAAAHRLRRGRPPEAHPGDVGRGGSNL